MANVIIETQKKTFIQYTHPIYALYATKLNNKTKTKYNTLLYSILK